MPRPHLTDDQKRVLVYLYQCEQSGTKPRFDNLDMTEERIEAALTFLASIGYIERT